MGLPKTSFSADKYSGKNLEEIIKSFIDYDPGSPLSKGFGVVTKKIKNLIPTIEKKTDVKEIKAELEKAVALTSKAIKYYYNKNSQKIGEANIDKSRRIALMYLESILKRSIGQVDVGIEKIKIAIKEQK